MSIPGALINLLFVIILTSFFKTLLISNPLIAPGLKIFNFPVKSITVDVRPAPFDSFTNFIDAVRMPFCESMGTVADVYEDDDVEHEPARVDNDDSGIKRPDVHHEEVFSTMQTFREQCQKTAEVLQKCNGEEDCARKKMALDVCFGKIICPTEANNFSNDPSEETYEPLNQCIAKFRASAT